MRLARPIKIAAGLAVAAAAVVAFGLTRQGSAADPAEAMSTRHAIPAARASMLQRPAQRPAVRGGLEGGVDWINVAGPIHLEDLRGKIVLLDFWTYCCINCHHVLPDLEYLEQKYPDVLVIIGVHTAKFDAEKDTDNIRKKVAEYRIKHPVINDANQVLWDRFGANTWPTLALIDSEGALRGRGQGRG